MDYRQRIETMKNRVLGEFNNNNQRLIHIPAASSQFTQEMTGRMSIIVANKVALPFIPVPEPPVVITTTPNPYTSIVAQVFTALESLLVYNASISLPPTKSARIAYLWFFTVASAYSWVTTTAAVTGTKDSWNWDTKNVLASDSDVFIWMTHTLAGVMSNFVPSYDTSALFYNERMNYDWTVAQQTDEWTRVSAAGNYTAWLSAWNTWYASRGSDGNVAAAVAPSDSVLPNGSTRLNVSVSQDISTYTNPRKWTPLIVNGVVKNFLTYGWGDVRSTCLTASDETSIKTAAASFFLGTGAARDTEIDNLVTLTNALTDLQKMTAEFWAGGPLTVSPPCMMIWFWKKYIEASGKGMNTMIYSGLELSINIFESSRLTWNLKRQYMEDRPIQEIRRRYATQNLTKYDGTVISGSLWVPYQETNFVTPPFADYPSGHSTFSQAFAKVMGAWFGTTIPTTDITMTDLTLLSPLFAGRTYVNKLSNIMIPANSSQIQVGVVPSADQALSWTTWQDIADSAGISRQYGGIHCQSAHLGGQSVANSIFPLVTSEWSITRV
jgi:hypothetical protein